MAPTKAVYRHIVLFQFKSGLPIKIIEGVESAFRTLCEGLPFVQSFEGGRNSSPENLNEGFSHAFVVTFADSLGRDAYLPHPDHQAFCRNFLDANVQKVCVVDYLPTVLFSRA